jgi:hypothetical protein
MNVFFLDTNPRNCAIYHCDRHATKMCLEYAQILCTAIWQTGGEAPYKKTHIKHPCNLWVLQSSKNFDWLTELGIELCKEYTHRYGRIHKCEAIIRWCIENKPNLPDKPMTEPALAMPEEFKCDNAINSYRKYYAIGKSHLHAWTNRQKPEWLC